MTVFDRHMATSVLDRARRFQIRRGDTISRSVLIGLACLGAIYAGRLVGRMGHLSMGLVAISFPLSVVVIKQWGLQGMLSILAMVFWVPYFFARIAPQLWGSMPIGEILTYLCLSLWFGSAIGSWIRKHAITIRSPFVGWLLLFTASGVVASTQALNRRWALEGLRIECLYALAIYVLVTNVVAKPVEAERLLRWLLLGGAAMIVVFSLTGGGVYLIARGRLGGQILARGPGTMIYAPVLADFCALLLPFVVSLGLLDRSWKRQLVVAFTGVILALALILTSGRAGWIAAAVSIPVVLFMCARLRGLRWQTILGVIVVGVLLWTMANWLIAVTGIGPTVADRFTSLSNISEVPAFEERTMLWRLQWKLAVQHPFGLGPGSFQAWYVDRGNHSTWQVMLVDVGFNGAAAFAIFLLCYLVRCVQGVRSPDPAVQRICVGAIGSLIAQGIGGISETLYSYYWVVGAVWIIFGATMAAVQAVKQK